MKKIRLALLIPILLYGCSKNSNISPKLANIVTINGADYPTTVIGSQIWTTVNYHGSGGYNVPGYSKYGTFFTQPQALAVTLPVGWRLSTIADYSKLFGNYVSSKDSHGNFSIRNNTTVVATLLSDSVSNTYVSNRSGFNALYSGLCYIISGVDNFYPASQAYFVTADSFADQSTMIYGATISGDSAFITGFDNYNPAAQAFSVRFVKDK